MRRLRDTGLIFLFAACWWPAGGGGAAEAPLPSPSRPPLTSSETGTRTNAPVRQLSPERYAVGEVTFDKSDRTIRFPASVNMVEGAVEYAVVHSSGKVHESVLKTEAEPYHIHLARLLLGPAETAATATSPGAPRDLIGVPVRIRVEWTYGGATRQVDLEKLVFNTVTASPMKEGPWIYNGSRMVEGVFLAQRDGSVVTIIADGDAMINNPRPGRDDDEIWRPNRAVLPAVGTAVQVTISLPKVEGR